jgi:hypothetical protein
MRNSALLHTPLYSVGLFEGVCMYVYVCVCLCLGGGAYAVVNSVAVFQERK